MLVVDDEPSIVDAVATSLRYEGFTVDEAITGRRALAQAQEDPPDLVILDVMLPDLDGLEVTRRLRADGLRVPVLFLTARDTLQDKLAGLTVGGDDYVTKPFALAEVIARVHAILRRTGYEPEDDGILRFSDLELDESADEVRRGGQCHQPDRDRVQPPPLLHAQPAARALQVADPRPRLALRLRRRRERRRDLRQLPAQETREVRPAAHPHHPPRRLHPSGAGVRQRGSLSVPPAPTPPRGRGDRHRRAGGGRLRHLLGVAHRPCTTRWIRSWPSGIPPSFVDQVTGTCPLPVTESAGRGSPVDNGGGPAVVAGRERGFPNIFGISYARS